MKIVQRFCPCSISAAKKRGRCCSCSVSICCRSALAPTLTSELRIETFNEAVHLVHGLLHDANISWGDEHFNGFQRHLWPEMLHPLAEIPRHELLDDLAALVPLIEHLGSQAAIEEFFYALRDVTTWWP